MIVLVEGQTIATIYSLHHPHQALQLHHRRSDKGEHPTLFMTGISLPQACVLRIIDEHRFAILRNVSGDPLSRSLQISDRNRSVKSSLAYQLQDVSIHHPQIDSLDVHYFRELLRDHWQQIV